MLWQFDNDNCGPFQRLERDGCALCVSCVSHTCQRASHLREKHAAHPVKRAVNANRHRLLILYLRGQQRPPETTPRPISGKIPGGGGRSPYGNHPRGRCEQWPPLRIIWRQTAASESKSITRWYWCVWWYIDLCKYLCQCSKKGGQAETTLDCY